MTEFDRANVLVVDDDQDTRDIILRWVEAENLVGIPCPGGIDALKILAGSDVDVVILDIMMPDLSGYEVCEYIKSHERKEFLPVILVTAKNDMQSKMRGFEVGADDYLEKPVERLELMARLRIQLRLKATREKLVRVNRMKDEFLSIASHDLKAPLAAIKGYCDNLLDGILGDLAPDARHAVERVRSNADRMQQLISDLLDIAAIDSGQVRMDFRKRDIIAFLRECHEAYAEQARSLGIEILLDVPAELPPVRFDNVKLREVMDNLVTNAFKFAGRGCRVAVAATRKGSRLQVSVADNGPGIPRNDMGKLFKRFSQTRVTSRTGEKGTGLGLSIVKKIVELHGGKIWCQSEEGSGATFTFSLPSPFGRAGSGRNLRVMIVDDDPYIRQIFVNLLSSRKYGCEVVEAENGRKALELMDEEVDIVFSDIKMPEMDGLELLRRVKEVHPLIPFVIITGFADHYDPNDLFEIGADEFIRKPFNIREIELVVEKMSMNLRESSDHLTGGAAGVHLRRADGSLSPQSPLGAAAEERR